MPKSTRRLILKLLVQDYAIVVRNAALIVRQEISYLVFYMVKVAKNNMVNSIGVYLCKCSEIDPNRFIDSLCGSTRTLSFHPWFIYSRHADSAMTRGGHFSCR